MTHWESVIGLEVHVQLQTQSKIFSGASTHYGADPNTQACAVDIALPGILPVMNRTAVQMAATFGLATGATINRRSVFARKNYFYPDLPKGYQISQYEIPIVSGGKINIGEGDTLKQIRITRAHLEEDAGKSLHDGLGEMSGIDLNRAGTPLLEVVSEPDMRSPAEAIAYLRKIHSLVRYLKICDGNMQEGSFRCDANISIRVEGDSELGIRTELKNINSFRFIERALNHEIQRQIDLIEDGGQVVQETRLYDPDTDQTRPMRGKEEAHDYRYFPDPDLPPLVIEDAEVEYLRSSLPELPDARCDRFIDAYQLRRSDAQQLTADRGIADYFEETVREAGGNSKIAANWVTGDLMAALNRDSLPIEQSRVSPISLGRLICRIDDQSISGTIAKDIFSDLWDNGGDVDQIIEARGLKQISDSAELEQVVEKILSKFNEQADQVRQGQGKVLGFLVGQVMKETGGKANPKAVNEILSRKLSP
ncbi:MAG: Asp-tRNA(Asn)/Glu-tRNA(Gln) amidotransferase subunit GatB [Pseudomonadota bacterium]|nr:Asp-tRNA(Asn)/Glu-tRNA(Gln) amidotransferase subunit GatB [Pseudomonadota bacterium]